ncbi:MAG: hypothetical protein OXC40_05580 [Proteobacteria bacterium]|nr:hypothetical protein [Pseudomonadota bacterium]
MKLFALSRLSTLFSATIAICLLSTAGCRTASQQHLSQGSKLSDHHEMDLMLFLDKEAPPGVSAKYNFFTFFSCTPQVVTESYFRKPIAPSKSPYRTHAFLDATEQPIYFDEFFLNREVVAFHSVKNQLLKALPQTYDTKSEVKEKLLEFQKVQDEIFLKNLNVKTRHTAKMFFAKVNNDASFPISVAFFWDKLDDEVITKVIENHHYQYPRFSDSNILEYVFNTSVYAFQASDDSSFQFPEIFDGCWRLPDEHAGTKEQIFRCHLNFEHLPLDYKGVSDLSVDDYRKLLDPYNNVFGTREADMMLRRLEKSARDVASNLVHFLNMRRKKVHSAAGDGHRGPTQASHVWQTSPSPHGRAGIYSLCTMIHTRIENNRKQPVSYCMKIGDKEVWKP